MFDFIRFVRENSEAKERARTGRFPEILLNLSRRSPYLPGKQRPLPLLARTIAALTFDPLRPLTMAQQGLACLASACTMTA
jgi:hypothetical protein